MRQVQAVEKDRVFVVLDPSASSNLKGCACRVLRASQLGRLKSLWRPSLDMIPFDYLSSLHLLDIVEHAVRYTLHRRAVIALTRDKHAKHSSRDNRRDFSLRGAESNLDG